MDSSRDIVKRLRENRILAERKEYEKMERNELIKLAKEGDQLAFTTLVDTHQDFISKMSHKYILDSGDRDDITQVATIAFWQAIQDWNMSGDFEAYAGMVIKRRLTDELRKDSTEKAKFNSTAASLDATSATDDEGGETTLGATIQSKSLSPEEEYLGNEGAKKIMKFMQEELSDVERKVIMKYIDGFKVSEISEEEGMKYKTVENALMRVKNKLAEYLRTVREARQDKINESIFSDEEKEILRSVLSKIQEGELTEGMTRLNSEILDKSYKNEEATEKFSESDFEDLLGYFESALEEIGQEIVETTNLDTYNDLVDKAKTLHDKLFWYDEYIPNELYEQYDELLSKIYNIEDQYHPENLKSVDPYAEVGMSRSDF